MSYLHPNVWGVKENEDKEGKFHLKTHNSKRTMSINMMDRRWMGRWTDRRQITIGLRVTHCEVPCWVIPLWRMTSTANLIIVCFCLGELQYNPSTTGIYLVSIQYFIWTRLLLILGLVWDGIAWFLVLITLVPTYVRGGLKFFFDKIKTLAESPLPPPPLGH